MLQDGLFTALWSWTSQLSGAGQLSKSFCEAETQTCLLQGSAGFRRCCCRGAADLIVWSKQSWWKFAEAWRWVGLFYTHTAGEVVCFPQGQAEYTLCCTLKDFAFCWFGNTHCHLGCQEMQFKRINHHEIKIQSLSTQALMNMGFLGRMWSQRILISNTSAAYIVNMCIAAECGCQVLPTKICDRGRMSYIWQTLFQPSVYWTVNTSLISYSNGSPSAGQTTYLHHLT